MGAHKSKDPRFRASIERGSKVFRRAILDTDRGSRSNKRSEVEKSREVIIRDNERMGMKSYSSLDGLHRRGRTETKTNDVSSTERPPEEEAKNSLWDGEVSDAGFRPRSSTYDGTQERHKHLSVHFASNLVSTRPSSHKSTGDIHLKGILRHDSVYDKHRKMYEQQVRERLNKLSEKAELRNSMNSKLTPKHRQRSASLENIRTKTQKTIHTDYNIRQQQLSNFLDSPMNSRKSRKDNPAHGHLLQPPRQKGHGSSRFHNADVSPSRSPNRASPAKSVRSNGGHSRSHGALPAYTNSPFSQRRLMLMSL